MADYIVFPIESDPDAIAQEAFDYIQSAFPDWEPNPGNLETWLIEAISNMIADLRDLAADVPPAIFRYLGEKLLKLPFVDAVAAVGNTNWTVTDDDGYTIPEGLTVGIEGPDGKLIPFVTVTDTIVPPGETLAEDVLIQAQELGEDGSGLDTEPQLIDTDAPFVLDVQLTGPTTGGEDEETVDHYLNRLVDELQLLSPRPILARDFAVMSRRVGGVERALALDNFDPADGSDDNERMVTIIPIDAEGLNVSGGTKDEVDELLQTEREMNFIVHVIDPERTTISVTFVGVAYPGYDIAAVEATAEDAVRTYLDPARWGQPPLGETREWYNEPNVRRLELAQVVNNVEGMDYIEELTLGVGAGAQSEADVAMAGHAPLPTAGTIAGTVNAP